MPLWKIIGALFRALTFRPTRHATARKADLGERVALTSWSASQYGSILLGLLLLLAVEVPLVHLLVGKVMESSAATTVVQYLLLALSACSAIWLIGDARLMKESAHEVGPDGLDVSLGLRWQGHIPYQAIASVEAAEGSSRGDEVGVVSIVPTMLDVPNVRLRLTQPVTLTGIFGIRREAIEVRLLVVDPAKLIEQILEHLIPARVGIEASVHRPTSG